MAPDTLGTSAMLIGKLCVYGLIATIARSTGQMRLLQHNHDRWFMQRMNVDHPQQCNAAPKAMETEWR
jgi:hypothetical protein